MTVYEIIALALALSADAFAVSVCKGTAGNAKELPRGRLLGRALICGAWFGGAQALMPTIGYFIGGALTRLSFLEKFTAWIACLLLVGIGINMLREAISNGEESEMTQSGASVSFLVMLPLAVATSIDALVSGVSIKLDGGNLSLAAPLIGCTTFTLAAIGYAIGRGAAKKIGRPAQFIGGIALIAIGVTILMRSYL